MLDQQMRMAKQMIDLQRVTFEGVMGNMIMLWDQTGNMLNSFMDQAVWVPEEGKKAFREWIDNNKKGCETFKSAVNNGYSNLEKLFADRSQAV